MINNFAQQLLTWFDQHGRHDLPWQKNRNAYRVWVSEIMLQQTQVATVIPYFVRFMESFPDLSCLANSHVDEVLTLWAGLGYYRRARNLHQCTQTLVQQHHGEFPDNIEALIALPGIGRSTAGAIISQAYNQPGVILDGNVKRVLTRLFAIVGWPGKQAIEQQLWQVAAELTPNTRHGDYTQAIMDLGATICKRSQPLCGMCPVQQSCQALQQNKVNELPTRKPKQTLPEKYAILLLLCNQQNQIQLQQRPAQGIWGGLWSLPEFNDVHALQNHLAARGINTQPQALPPLRHAFSHYKLTLSPQLVRLPSHFSILKENHGQQWYTKQQMATIGLPSPIKRLLTQHWTAHSNEITP